MGAAGPCPHLLPRNNVTFGTLFNENITFPDIIIAENNVLIRSSFAVKKKTGER